MRRPLWDRLELKWKMHTLKFSPVSIQLLDDKGFRSPLLWKIEDSHKFQIMLPRYFPHLFLLLHTGDQFSLKPTPQCHNSRFKTLQQEQLTQLATHVAEQSGWKISYRDRIFLQFIISFPVHLWLFSLWTWSCTFSQIGCYYINQLFELCDEIVHTGHY